LPWPHGSGYDVCRWKLAQREHGCKEKEKSGWDAAARLEIHVERKPEEGS
jgi:hypothetical protein